MAENLFGQLKVESVNREDIRDIVSGRVTALRTKFRTIPLQLQNFHLQVADQLRKQWSQEEKEFKREKKREKPLARLTRWKEKVKTFRLIGLTEVSKKWYPILWKLRSDMALISAMYEFSEIESISLVKEDLKPNQLKNLKPIVMRMKGPRKPTKKNILLRDLRYDAGDAFLEMVKPLEHFSNETKNSIDKLVAPRKKLQLKVKRKRYKDALIAREYLTLMCQATAPRQSATRKFDNEIETRRTK
ncbi:MAG: hypothetical protein ACW98K_17110 [Candidatus Kariarchaeaceae archaeon]|jgi:hypothetical protein